MQKNKVQSLQIRYQVNKLRKEKSTVEEGLNRLVNYEGSSIGLDKVLQLTLKALDKNASMEVEQDPTVFP